jgi:hypothetical protein
MPRRERTMCDGILNSVLMIWMLIAIIIFIMIIIIVIHVHWPWCANPT